jgi:hypothetical protein
MVDGPERKVRPPPKESEVFPEIVESSIVVRLVPLLITPPPQLKVLLFEIVEFSTTSVSEQKMPPPLPISVSVSSVAALLAMIESLTVKFPRL